jgi:hypothetical protein
MVYPPVVEVILPLKHFNRMPLRVEAISYKILLGDRQFFPPKH